MRRPSLSYANAMSTIAVFIALGGTSYAVARNSVGERELKDRAVTSRKIKNESIALADLSPTARIRGPRGPRGSEGPAGVGGAAAPGGAVEAWQALPFESGWGDWGGGHQESSFRKDQLGRVQLRGLASFIGGVPTRNAVVATLPAGYRPRQILVFAVGSGGPDGTGRLDVLPDGRLLWIFGGTSERDFTSLSGISFSVD